jgi:hypothetical protein
MLGSRQDETLRYFRQYVAVPALVRKCDLTEGLRHLPT